MAIVWRLVWPSIPYAKHPRDTNSNTDPEEFSIGHSFFNYKYSCPALQHTCIRALLFRVTCRESPSFHSLFRDLEAQGDWPTIPRTTYPNIRWQPPILPLASTSR